jgi:deferrochelatase/peroxidase EfeB
MSSVNRRRFLAGSLASLGASGAAVALTDASGARAGAAPDPATEARDVADRQLLERVPFEGAHQAGILTPRANQATFLALDSVATTPAELFESLQLISTQARLLSQGDFVGAAPVDDPPPDSGILGTYNSPDSLTVTVALGASLFNERYGLAHKRPRHLTAMPAFALDELDPARTGGDVLVQVCAGQRDTIVHTVRELMRGIAGQLTVRWTIDGFQTAQRGPHPNSSTRNLFAFRDGTANPSVTDAALMNRLVWAAGDEPRWTAGGTYMVVRTIRQHVEFWDRVGMLEQEQMIGRDRVTGAPLGGKHEYDDPRFDLDPDGERIPLDAHIRLANPRTAATADQRILRRGYSYHRGVDDAGNLDQGLVFVAFNQNPDRQFATIQRRLETEPMTDYITPVGGGYFFAPPGARSTADWVGSGLVSA